MRILINATNLKLGGSIQKAVEFYNCVKEYDKINIWLFLVSPQVVLNIDLIKIPQNVLINVIEISPAKIFKGFQSRKKIRKFEKTFNPDCIYTVFGPPYLKFKSPHLMGFAMPWITNPSKIAWIKHGNIFNKIRIILYCLYVAYWTRFADHWVLETKTAAFGLAKRLNKSLKLFHVVPNCCSNIYFVNRNKILPTHGSLTTLSKDVYKLLVFTSYIKHKNLESIPLIAYELKKIYPTFKFVFIFTFDTEILSWEKIEDQSKKLNVADNILNLGPQKIKNGPSLYQSCDSLFLPTLLEVFTATYPEAMCMKKPIITSDFRFSRDICRDAAYYINPMDYKEAAKAIFKVATDQKLSNRLIKAGKRRLNDFGTSKNRFTMYCKLIKNISTIRKR